MSMLMPSGRVYVPAESAKVALPLAAKALNTAQRNVRRIGSTIHKGAKHYIYRAR